MDIFSRTDSRTISSRSATLVNECFMLTALCVFFVTYTIAVTSDAFSPERTESKQCASDVLGDCAQLSLFEDIEESKSFELDDKDCVDRMASLPHGEQRSSRLTEVAKSALTSQVSKPHLPPPKRFSVSV